MKRITQCMVLISFVFLLSRTSPISPFNQSKTVVSHDRALINDPIIFMGESETCEVLPVIEPDIEEEMFYDDMGLLAQLIQAEAGNQDLRGKRLVGCVVMNRMKHPSWPNTMEEVIFQKGQFSVTRNGAFDKAGWHIDDDSFLASELCMTEDLIDDTILYFNSGSSLANGSDGYKYGDHWFGR